MKKINLSITGCLGRMGQQLIKSSKGTKNFKIVSVTENKKINKKVSGLRPLLNSKHAFLNTNVIGFLGETKGGVPVPMREAEVNRMLGKVDELALTTEHISIPFIVGENVKVIDGPFNGFTGSIEKVNEEKRKLEVMVKIFGRKTPLELSYMQVEKV